MKASWFRWASGYVTKRFSNRECIEALEIRAMLARFAARLVAQHGMETKLAGLRDRGITPLVVIQFAFDDEAIVGWVAAMRARGIDVPLRLGVPGQAGIKRLRGFAKRCGVGASASVRKKYGISLIDLIGSAGPDELVQSLDRKLSQEEHGRVRLHFYPLGGLAATAR